MRTGGWDYEIVARCRLQDAHALLSDLTRQGELHPLIIDVRPQPAPPGVLQRWAITDRLRFGPLSVRITYVADVLTVTDHLLETVARQRPRTTVRNTTRLADLGDGTVRLSVDVVLTAPAPLFGLAQRQGRLAHLELAARIREVLERS